MVYLRGRCLMCLGEKSSPLAPKKPTVDQQVRLRKAAKDHRFDLVQLIQNSARCVHCQWRGQCQRVAVDAGADAWKSDAAGAQC